MITPAETSSRTPKRLAWDSLSRLALPGHEQPQALLELLLPKHERNHQAQAAQTIELRQTYRQHIVVTTAVPIGLDAWGGLAWRLTMKFPEPGVPKAETALDPPACTTRLRGLKYPVDRSPNCPKAIMRSMTCRGSTLTTATKISWTLSTTKAPLRMMSWTPCRCPYCMAVGARHAACQVRV